ncbi:MAG TPA: pseudouridine synthase, partial [Burkholderiaceae bacterium]|nr:pseudouridine synthase [Burkholderiaceae bacterium]
VLGDWPAQKKVIDVALHKYLDAAGERRVRTVAADDEDGRRSITLVKVRRRFERFTLLEVTIKTGRTHQIRVHLAHEGHPIVGDAKYGDFAQNKALSKGAGQDTAKFGRMFLHAWRLAVDHPATGERLALEAALPAECETFLEQL